MFMATAKERYENIKKLRDSTCIMVAKDERKWLSFLDIAADFYKYDFSDQVLIYANRPKASALASYDYWNQNMNRYVRKGVHGVPLLDKMQPGKLKYVFDVTDTGEKDGAKSPYKWAYEDKHEDRVVYFIENTFGKQEGETLTDKILSLSSYLADDKIEEIRTELDTSEIDEMRNFRDTFNTPEFRSAMASSVAYIICRRMNIERREFEDRLSFSGISKLDSVGKILTCGDSIHDASREVLVNIGTLIRRLERESKLSYNALKRESVTLKGENDESRKRERRERKENDLAGTGGSGRIPQRKTGRGDGDLVQADGQGILHSDAGRRKTGSGDSAGRSRGASNDPLRGGKSAFPVGASSPHVERDSS